METADVFLSVGAASTPRQEKFIADVEGRLRSDGLIPNTVGRTAFSTDTPIKSSRDLMARCSGTIVLALERLYFPSGIEKRGGDHQTDLADVKVPTPWNHIEAALAYGRGHPLMVIVENGLRADGVLEKGNDWYVMNVTVDSASLTTPEFNGVLADFRNKVLAARKHSIALEDVSSMTLSTLIGGLKPSQLWAAVTALATALAMAFALGAKLLG